MKTVQNFKSKGIKNHKVSNVERVWKNDWNDSNIAFELEVRKQYGDSAQCRKPKRNTRDFKQNLQSFHFSSPIIGCKKNIMQMLRILEIDFRCINNQIIPGLSEIDPF